jgi:lysozyme
MEILSERARQYLTDQIISHEGVKLEPHVGTAGELTIGIGRNLSDRGVSRVEALILLESDIDYYLDRLSNEFSFFATLTSNRKIVLVNMAFNLGVAGLKNFRQMLTALEAGDYRLASAEMLESWWAIHVKNRAVELSDLMLRG